MHSGNIEQKDYIILKKRPFFKNFHNPLHQIFIDLIF